MKERLSILPMKSLAALALALALAPICLIAGCYFLPGEPLKWTLPPLFVWVWGSLIFLMPGKGRAVFASIGAVVFAVLGATLYRAAGLGALVILAPCAAALFLIPPAYAKLVWEEWSPGMWCADALLHLAAQIAAGQPMFSAVRGALRITFAAYMLLFLICFNRVGLRGGMHGAAKAPAALRARNMALTVCLFLIALAASLWDKLAQWADAGWHAVLRVIGRVIAAILSLLPVTTGGAGGDGGGPDFGVFGEAGEPSAVAKILEKVLYVVAAALLLLLVALAVRVLGKKLIELVKKIRERLRAYGARSAEDYVDEAESTLNWEEKTKSLREKIGKSFARAPRETPWEQLTGRERVRRLYRQYLKSRPEMKNKTAREALTEGNAIGKKQASAFAGLYEKARYSDHDVSSAEADEMRKTLQDTIKL